MRGGEGSRGARVGWGAREMLGPGVGIGASAKAV